MLTLDPLTPGNTQDAPDIDKGTFLSMFDDLFGDPTPPKKSRLPFWSFENFYLLLVSPIPREKVLYTLLHRSAVSAAGIYNTIPPRGGRSLTVSDIGAPIHFIFRIFPNRES